MMYGLNKTTFIPNGYAPIQAHADLILMWKLIS